MGHKQAGSQQITERRRDRFAALEIGEDREAMSCAAGQPRIDRGFRNKQDAQPDNKESFQAVQNNYGNAGFFS